MNNTAKKAQENTLYLKLQKEIKKKKHNKREYIPVAVFHNPENINLEQEIHRVGKHRLISIFSSIIK